MSWLPPERARLHIAMLVFLLGYGGNHVIMRLALNMRVSKLVFPLYRNTIAFAVLAPSAYFLEKYTQLNPLLSPLLMPSKFLTHPTPLFYLQERQTAINHLVSDTVLPSGISRVWSNLIYPCEYHWISAWIPSLLIFLFCRITLNQGFYIFGLDNSTPTFASATENAVPAVSFIMAVLLGSATHLLHSYTVFSSLTHWDYWFLCPFVLQNRRAELKKKRWCS